MTSAIPTSSHGRCGQVDAVIHLVALVGVGQSMYEMEEYTSVNNGGTAALMRALSQNPVESIVVASSMSIYGEGFTTMPMEEPNGASARTLEQLRAGQWEIWTKRPTALPVPTTENKPPALASVYAFLNTIRSR